MRPLLVHSILWDTNALSADVPERPGVFALFAADPAAQPYLSKTSNLRRRLTRLLRPSPRSGGDGKEAGDAPRSKRLELAHLVNRIEYTVTGSELESALCLYNASLSVFGEGARRRLRLHPPAFLRMAVENAYPRLYTATRISRAAAHALFGPFPSRAAAERYSEEVLNLFLLRRCTENLNPDPRFPGCIYSEMKMCLAPCQGACTDERYGQEAEEVFQFLTTRGASLASRLERERDQASETLEFEKAASLHQRMEKVQAVIRLASEAVRPLAQLSGVLIEPSGEEGYVSLFGLRQGFLTGPVLYSIAGMRLPNERSGSSSLFAHPVALQPIPLGADAEPKAAQGAPPPSAAGDPQEPLAALPGKEPVLKHSREQAPKDLLEARLEEVMAKLEQLTPGSSQTLSDHLALFARWFYSPAARRTGELIFVTPQEGAPQEQLPRKSILRAIARVAVRSIHGGADHAGLAAGADPIPGPGKEDGPLVH